MKHSYIKQVFINLKKLKEKGIWLSGVKKDGEYKGWYNDGKLQIHCFYKNGFREGVYKSWHKNGKLLHHCFCKNDKIEGESKMWYKNGKLHSHRFYKNGEIVKDYLKESRLI